MHVVFVGVDPCHEIFEFEIQGEQFALLNAPESFPRLVEQLRKQKQPIHVLCKSDGRSEAGVVATLQQSGIPVSAISTKDLCRFGGLQSPDDIDTSLLVRYGEARGLELEEAPRSTYIPPASRKRITEKNGLWKRLRKWLTRAGIRRTSPAHRSPVKPITAPQRH